MLLASLVIFFAWALSHLDTFAWDIDEGIYLMWTRMWRAGYGLYTDIWCDQPPGLILLVRLAFAVFGESVQVGRGIVAGLATLGLLAVALIARELDGWLAAVVSVLLLATAPLFVRLSRALMGSLPALALATLSLALMLFYHRHGQRRWLILSSLAFGASLIVKFIGLPLLAPIGLVLLIPSSPTAARWRTAIRDGFFWSLGALLPLVLLLVLFDSRAMLEQVIGNLFEVRSAYTLDLAANAEEIADVLSAGHLSLVALSVYGFGLALRRRSATGVVVLTWCLTAALALMIYTPVWYHLVLLVLIPLAPAAGMGVSQLIRLAQSRHRWTWADGVWVTLGTEAVVIFAFLLPQTLHELAGSVTWPQGEAWAAIEDLRALVKPGDHIITDHPIMAFRAGLFVPPDLCDPGSKRIKPGELTMADLLADIERYHSPPVVIWSGNFRGYLTEFVSWVEENYYPARIYDVEQRIYVSDQTQAGIQPPTVDFADSLTLLGHHFNRRVVQPGETIYLTLFWQAQQPIQTRYTMFTHLLDAEGQKWGQKDSAPWNGYRPTTSWKPGEPTADTLAIRVSPEAPPGEYHVAVGMYDTDTKKRLSVLDNRGQPMSSQVFLGPVTVRP